MSIEIHHIDMKPGDNFSIRYRGNTENSIAISVWENGKIMISGPMNHKQRKFLFSIDGAEEIKEDEMSFKITCNKCGSEGIKVWDRTFICNSCGNKQRIEHLIGAEGTMTD